ncbi:MAG: acyl-CoA dehydratase activase [Desulfotomaculaceae bacterium]|nr:acyl-CoA dehydratase activase [Desulfotomaculaceae bacterium]
MYFTGIDVGSTFSKSVICDEYGEVLGRGMLRTGADFKERAVQVLEAAKADANYPEGAPIRIIATGYGRNNIDFADGVMTEIACQAKGVFHSIPEAQTIVDIGGQDTKIVFVGSNGLVERFIVNRKCAAGTGAFLEEIARRLDKELSELAQLAQNGKGDRALSSYCTVFASSEVLDLLRRGVDIHDLARSMFLSVVARVMELATFGDKITLTGGVVANNPIVADLIREKVKGKVTVPDYAQFTAALGAAIIAKEQFQKQAKDQSAT